MKEHFEKAAHHLYLASLMKGGDFSEVKKFCRDHHLDFDKIAIYEAENTSVRQQPRRRPQDAYVVLGAEEQKAEGPGCCGVM